jgi:hypothetical protein
MLIYTWLCKIVCTYNFGCLSNSKTIMSATAVEIIRDTTQISANQCVLYIADKDVSPWHLNDLHIGLN